MDIKCVVAATNAQGSPDFYPVVVEVTQEQYDEGEHYEIAMGLATDQGYEGDMVVFDENDGPAFLFENLFKFLEEKKT